MSPRPEIPDLVGPVIQRLGAYAMARRPHELAMKCRRPGCAEVFRSSEDGETHRLLRDHWATVHPASLAALAPAPRAPSPDPSAPVADPDPAGASRAAEVVRAPSPPVPAPPALTTAAKPRVDRSTRPCPTCGGDVVQPATGRLRVYCSPACRPGEARKSQSARAAAPLQPAPAPEPVVAHLAPPAPAGDCPMCAAAAADLALVLHDMHTALVAQLGGAP